MSETFGIAVLGLDHWYAALAAIDALKGSDEFPLIGVAETLEWRREDLKSRGVEGVTEDFDALIQDDRVRAVIAVSATADNEAVSRKALEAGKHVFSVKPPAMTVERARSLVELAESRKLFFASFECMERIAARRRQVKALIRDGAIGKPETYFRFVHGGLPQPWPGQSGDSWWLHADKVPGGAWIDHAIYSVDEVRDLFETEIASVQATMENKRYKDLTVEDCGIATFQTEADLTAVVEYAWMSDQHSATVSIIGREGSLHLAGPAAANGPLLIRKGASEVLPPVEDEAPANFTLCRQLRDGELPYDGRDSLANLSACLTAYQSAKEGRRLAVD